MKLINKISVIFLLIFVLTFFIATYILKEKKTNISKPISLNLLTSVHPDLPWNFKPIKPIVLIKPGEVTTIEYMVENNSNKESTGVATFAYFPNQVGTYISKINCFCYDAKTLKPLQKEKYVVILLIDPEVTKDPKTNDIKDITIQFTFFEYKKALENKS